MHYDETTYTLHFTLPPRLYQTDAAIVFMGATLNLDMFRSVFAKGTGYFKEPQIFDAASTECLAPVCTHETSQGIYTFQF